ncbi:molybdenum cofactor biosynthesis protein B [Citrobacter braakii]|nr:molybdenum cofactor biosynthesis protein B [Citrobacter braakii]
MSQVSAEFIPTRIAILTVSNRRGEEDDTSGHYLRDSAQEAGHQIVDKAIVKEKPLRHSRPGFCMDCQ